MGLGVLFVSVLRAATAKHWRQLHPRPFAGAQQQHSYAPTRIYPRSAIVGGAYNTIIRVPGAAQPAATPVLSAFGLQLVLS